MLIFYLEGSRITGEKEKGEFISLIPFYHFHQLHEHLDISWVINAESSPLHIATDRTRTSFPSASDEMATLRKISEREKGLNAPFE